MQRKYTLEFWDNDGRREITIRAGGDREAITRAKRWLGIPGRALVLAPKSLTRTTTGLKVWLARSYTEEDPRFLPLD